MTVERNHAGAWVIYATDADGYLVTRTYYGYTKQAAKRLFRQELRA